MLPRPQGGPRLDCDSDRYDYHRPDEPRSRVMEPVSVEFFTDIEKDGAAVSVEVRASVWPHNAGSRSEPPSGPEVGSLSVIDIETGEEVLGYEEELKEQAIVEFDSY